VQKECNRELRITKKVLAAACIAAALLIAFSGSVWAGTGKGPAKPQKTATASFGVFADLNGNGNKGESDPAYAGAKFTLSKVEGKKVSKVASAVSDAKGTVTFKGLKNGLYVAKRNSIKGFASTNFKSGLYITVKGGKAYYGDSAKELEKGKAWVGLKPYATVSVTAYIDKNANKSFDKKDSVKAGFKYTLYKIDGKKTVEIDTDVSDSDGVAAFGKIGVGTYKIVQSKAKGYEQTTYTKGVYAKVAYSNGKAVVTYGQSASSISSASAFVGSKSLKQGQPAPPSSKPGESSKPGAGKPGAGKPAGETPKAPSEGAGNSGGSKNRGPRY
jgi:uncharacterized surface anchored protein